MCVTERLSKLLTLALPCCPLQSWVHGQLIKQFEPEAVELYKSQGYETPSSKHLMRLTVLLSDVLSE